MASLTIKVKKDGTRARVALEGQIDEGADYQGASLEGCKEVEFDFSGVTLINSTGLQRWIRFLEAVPQGVKIDFSRCPVRVINQINMFPGFLGGRQVAIRSFYAPYYCESCDVSKAVLIERASFGPGDQSAPELNCDACGSPLEFDGIEKKYFLFLTKRSA